MSGGGRGGGGGWQSPPAMNAVGALPLTPLPSLCTIPPAAGSIGCYGPLSQLLIPPPGAALSP